MSLLILITRKIPIIRGEHGKTHSYCFICAVHIFPFTEFADRNATPIFMECDLDMTVRQTDVCVKKSILCIFCDAVILIGMNKYFGMTLSV